MRTIESRTIRWLALAGLTTLAAACSNTAEAEPEGAPQDAPAAEATAAPTRVINVETTTLAPREFVETIHLTGTVWADRDVTISAEEAGTVVEILADKGTKVRKGQALLRIDDRVLRAQVDEARAQAELARETWERRKRLFEEDNVGSELAYLEARAAAEQTAARLRTLEERLARTVVRAPFAGVLDERLVELGALVAPGTPVARVVRLDPVKIVAGVPERYAPDVRVGARATVYFDVLDGASFEGDITYVGSTVDPRNRTFGVELRMANPKGVIKPEMIANVDLVRQVIPEAMVVPREALVRVEDGFEVFVVVDGADGPRAEARPVKVGASQSDEVVVLEGVAAGDRLIVVGQKLVADGDRVNVVGE